jgi:hypothetical protein
MKRLLLLSLFAIFVVALPAQAHAAIPCRNQIFNDWYADGKIASTYSHACYVDALHHIPPDAKVYSNLGEDITAAMRASIRRTAGQSVPKQVGHGFKTQNVLAASTTATSSKDPSNGEKTASGGGIVSSASNAPLPILVLGGLAIALAAAGAIGSGVKYARSKRS